MHLNDRMFEHNHSQSLLLMVEIVAGRYRNKNHACVCSYRFIAKPQPSAWCIVVVTGNNNNQSMVATIDHHLLFVWPLNRQWDTHNLSRSLSSIAVRFVNQSILLCHGNICLWFCLYWEMHQYIFEKFRLLLLISIIFHAYWLIEHLWARMDNYSTMLSFY